VSKRAVVTGAGGFIGAYLVRALLHRAYRVACIDNLARGDLRRLAGELDSIEFHRLDVRDEEGIVPVLRGADVVFHLAAINGTENFYLRPQLVLDVGLRGALAVVGACAKAGVPDLVVASSAEVYQTPPKVPTDETVPLTLPNSLNPRYSYGGSKIVSELIAFDYHREHFKKVQVFRPHNVYGPDMGFKHVIPQFITRMLSLDEDSPDKVLGFEIQGDGSETRAFAYVDDVVGGILLMYERGGHREIYHIGNDEEVSIAHLARVVAEALGMEIQVTKGPAAEGGTPRRCPDISKMRSLGYSPRVNLAEGVAKTVDWYRRHLKSEAHEAAVGADLL
jgi:UDP-glucose 4-epimerase